MTQQQKFLIALLSGQRDQNLSFASLIQLLEKLEFNCRIKGSHHIFFKNDVDEILNLQPIGHLAKAYQVKQVREVLLKYQLAKGVISDE
jgi:predicted RNA binding protein YcfA (HicA-like mRNA interferase family)